MQAVQTAPSKRSIWKTVGHEHFRSTVRKLQKATNEVPKEPKYYDKADWISRGNHDVGQVIPFDVETHFADELAFLAATEEGARAVATVAIEQHLHPRSLVVVLAANEAIPKDVCSTFEKLFEVLQQCASLST
jgi:hypothetical protein